jgi:2-keto-4-pentenoate hydratase/2-oxohepta-3-ene-1,7-dioic acid hydratase in catechol pathway
MRWVRYEQGGAVHYGQVQGEQVLEVEGLPWAGPRPTGRKHALSGLRLLAPVLPPTFYAAGLNYTQHLKHYAALGGPGAKIPEKPDIGYRAANALTGHEAPILIPRDAGPHVHYEGELVVVIGREAKHLSHDEALSCVFGYTIGNDVSERDWQKADRTLWRSKNSDTWKPMGPWIDTDFDLEHAETIVRVNGKETIRFATKDMLFDVPTYISAMSRYLTLHPGDVIWMGTEGVSPDLKVGDVCEIEITGLGTLRNDLQADA